ncbi:MAG: hypothetical protein VYE69_04615, partial [Pseudomonadota bacterium]|nr:hypothetical protein [Pseudomonadota bacterium]
CEDGAAKWFPSGYCSICFLHCQFVKQMFRVENDPSLSTGNPYGFARPASTLKAGKCPCPSGLTRR